MEGFEYFDLEYKKRKINYFYIIPILVGFLLLSGFWDRIDLL